MSLLGYWLFFFSKIRYCLWGYYILFENIIMKIRLSIFFISFILYGHIELQNLRYSSIWDTGFCNRQQKSLIFAQDCSQRVAENKRIPIKDDSLFRILTYNIHGWTDCFWSDTFAQIHETICALNADIILLQEAGYNSKIKETFFNLGYIYQEYCDEISLPVGPIGNLILSKIPFLSQEKRLYNTPATPNPTTGEPDLRSYVKVLVEIPNKKKIMFYCTHLDVYDESDTTRLGQVHELIELTKQDEVDFCIIGADCNAVRKKDYPKVIWDRLVHDRYTLGFDTCTKALEAFEMAGFKDSFSLNNQKSPGFTVWSGLTIDFLWVKNKHSNSLSTASYVYYDAASDHIPVIMDIAL